MDNSKKSILLIYTNKTVVGSGGSTNIFLLFLICKNLNIRVKLCPILKNIDCLGNNFRSPFHNKSIESLSQEDFYNYYLLNDKENIIKKEDIVLLEELKNKDNIIIYPEDVIGNPAQQKYVVRWLLFFPQPNSVQNYSFENDYICFFSDYIYNLYDNLCKNIKITNLLTPNIKTVNILRVFHFDYKKYNNINKIDNKREGICYTDRKFYPPNTFLLNDNIKYTANINRLIMNDEMKNNKIIKFRDEYSPNFDLFIKKEKFISYDRFTFLNIIAAINGCISIVKPIDNLDAETYRNADPFNKYGIAYGDSKEEIKHAITTQHLVLEHISNMFFENRKNVYNFINDIEKKFNISLQI